MASYEQQRRLADMLRAQSVQPIQANTGAVSWTQGLAKMFQAHTAKKYDQRAQEAEEKEAKLKKNEMDQFIRALQGERAVMPMQPGVHPSYQTPAVQSLAAQQTMSDIQRKRELADKLALQNAQTPAKPAELATFEAMTQGWSPEDTETARQIWAGLQPRAVGSAAITTANTEGMTDAVADSESTIRGSVAGAEETARLTVQGQLRPKIEADIATARANAEAQGVAFTESARAQAAMPGLQDVVSRLKALGEVATYTQSGQALNAVARELGFQPSEGATARAAYIATVSNEILPLLRDTFGAQFTEREGETLKATLGDPNMSPAEKNAQLDAFIAAKMRGIETKGATTQMLGAQVPTTLDQPSALSDVDEILRRAGVMQ